MLGSGVYSDSRNGDPMSDMGGDVWGLIQFFFSIGSFFRQIGLNEQFQATITLTLSQAGNATISLLPASSSISACLFYLNDVNGRGVLGRLATTQFLVSKYIVPSWDNPTFRLSGILIWFYENMREKCLQTHGRRE